MRRIIDTMWSFFKLGVVAVLLAATAIGVYFYVHMDDEVRNHVEAELSRRFPQLEVRIGSARLADGRGIVVEDVFFDTALPSGQREQVLSVDRLTLLCDVALGGLLQGPPKIEGIEVVRPQLWVKQLQDGTWNIARLTPVPCGDVVCPKITVRQGKMSLESEAQPHLPALILDSVELNVSAESNASPQAPAKAVGANRMRIDGALSGSRLHSCEVRSTFDPSLQQWEILLTVERLDIAEETQVWLNSALPAAFRGSQVTAQVDGTIAVRHVLGGSAPLHVDANLDVHRGRIDDARLGRPIVEISGKATANGSQLNIENLHGKWGDAQVAMSLARNGWFAAAPLALSGVVRGVPLDAQLYQSLPPIVRTEWDKYAPAGECDGEFQAAFDGTAWRLAAGKLTGRNLSFQSEKFPYRLVEGSGTLRFEPPRENEPSRVDIDLVGIGGGQPLAIVGQIVDPKPTAAGWVTITGRDVEIERPMIDALPEKTRGVIASLHPIGRFDFEWRLEREIAGQPKFRKRLLLKLHELEINYDRFAYPLRGIEGTIVADDNHWEFKDLVSSGRRAVRCEGRLDPVVDGTELILRFQGDEIPLDSDLFEAVSAPVQRAWSELQAHGHVDFNADMYYRSGLPKPTIHAVVRPCSATAQIKPRFFDYLLENVSGVIVYRDGEITLEGMRAVHDSTAIRTNGAGAFGADGSWHFQLTDLNVDKITPRRDLLVALPRRLQRVVDLLKPTGYFNVSQGTLAFRKGATPVDPVDARWKLQLNCHQTDLQAGVELKNIYGAVQLNGAYDGRRSYTSGSLDLDAVTLHDVVFTGVRGPLWVDESQCLLGKGAASIQQAAAQRVTAAAYDGAVAADARLIFETLPKYAAEIDWVGADLDRLLLERFGGAARCGGKVDAKLSLHGEGRRIESMEGDGSVFIREADIYELPMLLGMLKTLRTGSSDRTAFDRSEMKFRLQGKTILLDQLDFLGDVVNLYGKGYTNFDRQLNLVFHGVVGRNPSRLPFVKQVVGKVNQQFLEMYVGGTMENPEVTTEALPQVKRFLEQIHTDLASPPRNLQR